MKKIYILISFMFLAFILISCTGSNDSNSIFNVVKIIYTNDIHSFIANTKKDSNQNAIDGLRLNNLSGYVKKLKQENDNVLLVDAGDEVQGSVYGAIDRGTDIINIMNNVGYNLATPGNHDFDFGMDAFNGFVNNANFPYISCNFKRIDGTRVLEPYKIFEINNSKIAFIGISTPETITSSTPTFFKDDNGDFIYKFDGQENKNDLYDSVQNTIDEIRNQVDYVIALGHLGIGFDQGRYGIRSIDVINNTTGIDAFIDAHSHTLMEHGIYNSRDNKDVVLTQTGSYLDGIGEMDISSNGEISTKIINDISETDSKVKALEDNLINRVDNLLGEKIAFLENDLKIYNPLIDNQRIIRSRETNLGNIASDSFYWYLNEYKDLDCDIVLTNGGGLRTELKEGDITYLNVKTVMPFGNQICLIKTKGINIKNALEMGLTVFDKWDDQYNRPAENGSFMHVAGMKYEADANVESSIVLDENGMFKSVDGEYRVKNIMVYNKETKEYEPLDENKEYNVGGFNYILRNSGDGLSMFSDSEAISDYIEEDYTAFSKYLMEFNESNGSPYINNLNSPLHSYENYLYDYENPYGSGRIKLLNLNNDI